MPDSDSPRRTRQPRQTSSVRIILSCSVNPEHARYVDTTAAQLGVNRNQLLSQCIKVALPILLAASQDWPTDQR